MRVLFLDGNMYAQHRLRGALMRDIRDRGHEVIASASDFDESLLPAYEDDGISFYPAEVDRRGLNPLSDFAYYRMMCRIVRDVKPDFVLARTAKAVAYGLRAAHRESDAQTYALIAGAGAVLASGGLKANISATMSQLLLRSPLHKSRRVFFQNDDDLEQYVKLKLVRPEQVIKCEGSGIDTLDYVQEPTPSGPLHFSLIARLIPEKGIFEFVEAARLLHKHVPDARFSLVGPFERRGNCITSQQIDEWEKDPWFEYHGSLSDVRPILRSTSVYVLPSYYREGQPRTVLEAMAIGRPILTTDSPGCRETVDPGKNGFLVAPRDAHALFEGMLRFSEDQTLVTLMGNMSRSIAESKYDIRIINRQIIEAMGL